MKTPIHRRVCAWLAAAAALAAPLAAPAEDIDIFTAGSAGVPPNVLIVIDNSSNWSATLGPNPCNTGNMAANTKFAAEMCALIRVVRTLNEGVRVGLMMFADSGDNGSYLRFGMRDMTQQNKDALVGLLSNMVASGAGTDNSGSNQPYAKTMYEAFKYFGGYTDPANAFTNVAGAPISKTAFGRQAFAGGSGNPSGTKRRDYTGNGDRSARFYGADNNTALPNQGADTYNDPILQSCAKTFIIFISNGNPATGGDSSINPARDTDLLRNIRATTSAIPNAAAETHASKFDEMALFLKQTDVSPLPGRQNVITYTIGVYQPQRINADGTEVISNSDQEMIKLMKSAASAGGGKYYAGSNPDKVAEAIFDILNEVQAVNSVFVSASLPVSVNNQGTFLNQVYMGMFRPDPEANARWMGNLKQYKFRLDASTGAISLADSRNVDAVNPATGFLSPSAVSFWTRGGTDPAGTGWPAKDFWINSPSGTPISPSDTPDGEVVEKGGAALQARITYARNQDTRRVFTCLAGGCTAGAAPDEMRPAAMTGATYQAAFGVASDAAVANVVRWIRGEDNFNGAPCDPLVAPCAWSSAENGPGWPATVRPSIHGDVLHSRPVVLNYTQLAGCADTGCPYIFYGANDGTLRAVKGGQAVTDGNEQWAFVAPEFFPRFLRLRAGVPKLRTPDTPAVNLATTLPKDYFFDGPIGSYESPDGATKWLFVTARRGGRVIYAFDVSDPANPRFLWKKTGADLPRLGQTWSLPVAFKHTDVADPYLVFGAGYDIGDDQVPAVNNNVGRGIYVLNARTGESLRFIDTAVNAAVTHPIPSDIAFLVSGSNQVYRGYVGDLGGNLWRLDISGAPGDWKLFKLAGLGATRKFFFAPDIVRAGGYDVVLLGSGDREKPLDAASVDAFFAVNDTQNGVTPADNMVPLDIAALTPLTTDSGTDNGTGLPCAPPGCRGWYRQMAPGEKVINSPLTVAGITFFSTNKPLPRPADDQCAVNLGEAKAYGVSFATGGKPSTRASIAVTLTGGGLPPSPVGGLVEIEPGKLVTFVIGSGDKGSAIEGGRVNLAIPKTRTKIYWNTKVDK